MEMTYRGALVMPSSYAMMDEEEMTYLEGGKNADTLGYNVSYLCKIGAQLGAINVISSNGWSPLLVHELAAEILFHALGFYSISILLNICSTLGYSASAIRNSGLWGSLANGIDVNNHKDTKTFGGVPRYIVYRAVYAVWE